MAVQIVGGHEAFILAFICALLPGMDEGIEPEASLPKELILLSCVSPPSATPAPLSVMLRLKSALDLRPAGLVVGWLARV